jgi:hypothetical protein
LEPPQGLGDRGAAVIVTQNAGVKIPLTFSVGYAF